MTILALNPQHLLALKRKWSEIACEIANNIVKAQATHLESMMINSDRLKHSHAGLSTYIVLLYKVRMHLQTFLPKVYSGFARELSP